MRKSSTIDALFPAVRQEVLAATLMQPQRWWYLSDLAVHLKRSPSSLQREVVRLTEAGILETRQEANRIYYRSNAECPLIGELTGLIMKTVGLADRLRLELSRHTSRVDWAFIYGSVARGKEVSESDIDLIVIGKATLSDLAPSLRAAEKQLGRPVNASIYPRQEFAAKLRAGNHFVRTVVASDKLFLLGAPREFAIAFAVEKALSAHDKPR
jgi:predicted nucleotidyltransferase